jgi:2-polyprenyl-3-methyl-5-hydroxy-6-metoxy-1,4-benzoquinol methylase
MGRTHNSYLFSADSFGSDSDRERARLNGIEALWDPGSQALLAELGLGTGWRCLEVGAGGGSLVGWMAGRGASVTAVDIDTQFIEYLSDTVDVRRLDIRTDPLPEGGFDLIHARLVLQHLSDRQEVLNRLAATLTRGSWIVIEELDWAYFGWEPADPALNAITEAVLAFAEQAGGVEINYGRQVLTALNRAGATDLRCRGRAQIIGRSSPGFDFFKLTIDGMRQPVVETGAVSEADAAAAVKRLQDKDLHLYTPMMIAGIGRRSCG